MGGGNSVVSTYFTRSEDGDGDDKAVAGVGEVSVEQGNRLSALLEGARTQALRAFQELEMHSGKAEHRLQ